MNTRLLPYQVHMQMMQLPCGCSPLPFLFALPLQLPEGSFGTRKCVAWYEVAMVSYVSCPTLNMGFAISLCGLKQFSYPLCWPRFTSVNGSINVTYLPGCLGGETSYSSGTLSTGLALWCEDNGKRIREHNVETHSGLREQGWAHATLPGPVLSM